MIRRVAITGLGVISALGRNRHEFWKSLASGTPGIAPLQEIPASTFRFSCGAEVRGHCPLDYFEPKTADLLDRFAQFASIAAAEALDDAGRECLPADRTRVAVVTGTCVGGQSTEDAGFFDLYRNNNPRGNPLTIPRVMANAGASFIALQHRITGPVFTLSTACASSNHAIGQAALMIRNGMVDVAIAGGSEAVFSIGLLRSWEAMRVVSPDTCRPFSKNRKGLILGEGGAMLVLEDLEAARARGARVYAEIAGFGMSSDAHHITQPSVEGPALAMRAALRDANLAPEQIGYINAHGTGTQTNDPVETRAIQNVFGCRTNGLAVSSTKSMHGHTLGAAGAIEAVATVLAMVNGLIPPTANYCEPDPACDLDVVPNDARPKSFEAALSNAFAFGGLNAVLAFRAA